MCNYSTNFLVPCSSYSHSIRIFVIIWCARREVPGVFVRFCAFRGAILQHRRAVWQAWHSEHVRAGARADVRRDCAFRGGFGPNLRCWEDGIAHETALFGIVRPVVVSDTFSANFCVLKWFRTDLGDADVMRMQDLGAGIAFSWWFRTWRASGS